MIIKLPLMLHNIISKQFKISHVPCDVIAFKKEDIPTNISKLIVEQYDEKFLEDCDTVLFVKGPIDKKMRKKIFKAADKALGEGANMMNEQDFRLLKLHDDDDSDFRDNDTSDEENDEEKIDKQVNDIVDEPDDEDDSAEETEDDNDSLEDNEDAVSDVVDESDEEDNSLSAMIHQGKSIAQWCKQFKGEFTVPQLARMAMSGTDLGRLLSTFDGTTTLEEDEDKANDIDSEKSNAEDADDDANEEDNDKENDNDTSDDDVKTVPTRFVFLKISMKG